MSAQQRMEYVPTEFRVSGESNYYRMFLRFFLTQTSICVYS